MKQGEHDTTKVDFNPAVARDDIASLLRSADLNHWYLRVLSSAGLSAWEEVATVSMDINETIKLRLSKSHEVAELVIAFVGNLNWRGREQLMIICQRFRAGSNSGIKFGSHLKAGSTRNLEPQGGLLFLGACSNLWI